MAQKRRDLVSAVSSGDVAACARLLHSGGVSPSLCDKTGVPLVCTAAQRGRSSVLRQLLKQVQAGRAGQLRWRHPLALAVRNGHMHPELLLELEQMWILWTPRAYTLMIAAYKQSQELCGMLVSWGADPKKRDANGSNTLMWSARELDKGIDDPFFD